MSIDLGGAGPYLRRVGLLATVAAAILLGSHPALADSGY
jgi:hypothetical protein